MKEVKIIISPIVTVSPTIEVNFNISTVVKLMENLVKVLKRINK